MNGHFNSSSIPLSLNNISRIYNQGGQELVVFKNINLNIASGELASLVGPSGAGKSSILHIAGLLELPDNGDVLVNGTKSSNMSDGERTLIRRQSIGFIYQFHYLLQDFTALENITIPQLLNGSSKEDADIRSEELLVKLNIIDRKNHLPGEMSGGEQQRVSIARALANQPSILIADEPTGNLDPSTAEIVFNEFIKLAKEEGLSALIATHNMTLADSLDRKIILDNGSIY
ncbi:MAG: ABC transporter ATP-binding protein [Rhodobiaceae bacterium]|jgi:lipoprotein-releasing system ATP-binding protein|nr:ABC transporter ATP-binding protein [Rhodobiaceae bacterium]MBT6223551.1 ABC transporter ATP-binding protein [Rhodobiaceae bacterium]MDC3272741.1 ABC transporter ATP-binding protein [Hyphomicrobiales bacterium]|tara:strand:- start:3620 stop:4312 length:693 start_codon:yes stop_codon:yes gene_type:complete